ncbi:hypothetical protein [Thiobacter aerophilum]|uniref:Uncharacterized protein n=1 Tax=Thiobacter aerophilum TaxID=3121275 RepID=A0ABV0ECI1_9BURK
MSNWQRNTFAFMVLAVTAWFGIAQALDAISSVAPKSPCEKEICFITPKGKVQYEKEFDCKFKDCHLANGEDIFRWAIGKKETGSSYGYDTPDENPCNAGNDYCAATTGNPASAGQKPFYAASYGTQQVTLGKLFEWINPNGATKFNPPPQCLKEWFLDDKALMGAMKDADKARAFGAGLVSGRKVPAATVNTDGTISYPAIPTDIKTKAVELKILKEDDAKSVAEWKEMWERMAAWERLRQIIEAKWKEMNGDKAMAWKALSSSTNTEYLSLLDRVEMLNSSKYYRGIKPYIESKIWNEAAATFGNYALFAAAPPKLYTRLMAFFANTDCHIAAVKQIFELPKRGYDGKHADPEDAETEKWVKKAAGAWNGSGAAGDYAKEVFDLYKAYYAKHFGKTEVCN